MAPESFLHIGTDPCASVYSLGYNQQHLLSWLKLSQLWSLGAAVSLRPAHLLVFSPLPSSGSVRSTVPSCVFSAQPSNQPFLREPWFIWGVFTLENATQVFGTGTRWHHSCFRAFLTGSTGPRTLGHLRHVPPHVTCPLSSPNIQASYSVFCGQNCWSQRDF